MKTLSFLVLLVILSCSADHKESTQLNIIPRPNSVDVGKDLLRTKGVFRIIDKENQFQSLVDIFKSQASGYIKFNDEEGTVIAIQYDASLADERYKLSIKPTEISVKGGTKHGVFNGLQTLLNLMIFANEVDGLTIPCCEIDDSPRFLWRGVMLDESRHFFGMEEVKQLLDVMAMHKLNTFHWHLTDEPGWRIEIKKYPKLTEIGGIGNYHDDDAPAMYYTQEQIKEIVRYAEDRFIQIIPEIDMPGHAVAANKAYPEFSGGGSKAHPEWTFNPGYEGTYAYLTDILKEVAELFPAPYIHLGGDEVSFGNAGWKKNEDVVSLMKTYGFKDLKEVERYFINRMADSISAMNRMVIGWDEIVEAGVPADKAISMFWRQDKTDVLYKSLEQNYQLVLSPRVPLYFDFVQDSLNIWGRIKKGVVCDLKNVYQYPPDSIPEVSKANKQILGIQANIWSERIQNSRRLEYMTYPRLHALAEAAWTQDENKDYMDFERRIKTVYQFLDDKEIYYYNIFDPASSPEPEGIPKKKR